MTWQEIRKKYPQTWLLVEAIKAQTVGDKRIVEELSVIDTFGDGNVAMKAYSELHKVAPQREMLVLHTDRQELDITVRHWLGIRGVR
jgi:hypothetical protein